jgi:hypothetical protein
VPMFRHLFRFTSHVVIVTTLLDIGSKNGNRY